MMPSIPPTGHNILIAQYGVLVAAGPQAWKAHAKAILDYLGSTDPYARKPGDLLGDWAVIGDTVMYSRYAGKGVYDPLTGEEYYLIHDEDVLAVLPPHTEWKWNPAEKDKEL